MSNFLAEKNLTETPFWRRLTRAQQRRQYDAWSYQPQVNGIEYDVENDGFQREIDHFEMFSYHMEDAA